MADIPSSEYLHRSIDQLRSMNERGINDYKPFSSLRNNIVTDYTIKANLNNNNNLIDNRNTSANNNQSPGVVELKHQHYSVPSTPPTPLSITEAQMNDAKVRLNIEISMHEVKRKLCIFPRANPKDEK